MAARPTITVWSAQGESSGSLPLPAVFTAPIRLDVVQQVHSKFNFLHVWWHARKCWFVWKGTCEPDQLVAQTLYPAAEIPEYSGPMNLAQGYLFLALGYH